MRIKNFSILILLLFSNYLMAVDEPDFNSTFKDNNLEIREYAPKILAQVSVNGDFDEASSNGFKLLADFIFGNNISADGVYDLLVSFKTNTRVRSVNLSKNNICRNE